MLLPSAVPFQFNYCGANGSSTRRLPGSVDKPLSGRLSRMMCRMKLGRFEIRGDEHSVDADSNRPGFSIFCMNRLRFLSRPALLLLAAAPLIFADVCLAQMSYVARF